MDKFTRKNPNYRKNTQNFTYKYLNFFIFQGKAYPIGAWVELTEKEKFRMHLGCACDSFKVKECYFQNERLCLYIDGYRNNKITSIQHQVFSNLIDAAIAKVIDAPIDDNHQEYVDFVNTYQAKASKDNFTREEAENIKYATRYHIPLEEIDPKLPERVKHVEAAKREACNVHKDWEYPEIIIGWIVLIVACIFVGIFKDFWSQWILRTIAILYFFSWREKQILRGRM